MNGLRSRPRPARLRSDDSADARQLALELAGLTPLRIVDVMSLGLVLEPGERALRQVPLEVRHADRTRWTGESRGVSLLTDRRLLVNLETGHSISFWWGTLVGFRPCVEGGYAVLDYGDGIPRLLSSRALASIAVAGVAVLYGNAGLVEHPALALLRGTA
ncbi:hypothetical protein ASE25_11355 [Terrabacter sp. Root85]|uniref:hypothetical protein n=1 Tax=Terrabacter sp. Root85 TaxID=1736603 RepID=UPI0007151C60|nr:hypothetical protein [Terrabacter sp. Root85]KRC90079.1 hypothetical protein ASE25_11355 [Terrabacter sp. Root85]